MHPVFRRPRREKKRQKGFMYTSEKKKGRGALLSHRREKKKRGGVRTPAIESDRRRAAPSRFTGEKGRGADPRGSHGVSTRSDGAQGRGESCSLRQTPKRGRRGRCVSLRMMDRKKLEKPPLESPERKKQGEQP